MSGQSVYGVLNLWEHWDWKLHVGVPSEAEIEGYVQGRYTRVECEAGFTILVNRLGPWAFRGQGPSGTLTRMKDGVAHGMICGPVVAVRYADDDIIVSLTTEDIAELHNIVDRGYAYLMSG